jgi:uncharacterized protein YlxP (DUF503 family)
MLHACALTVELQIPGSRSLKSKRSVVKPIVERSKSRFGVAAAEVDFLDQWQRAELAFAAVGGSQGHVQEVLDAVERFVWSQPDIEVLRSDRHWIDDGR